MADDLGGDALAYLAFGLRIDRQGEIRMGFDVDKTRRDREILGIDDFSRAVGDVRPDCGDAAVRDGEVRGDAGIAGAVVQNSAADEDVVHVALPPLQGRAKSFTASCTAPRPVLSRSSRWRLRCRRSW